MEVPSPTDHSRRWRLLALAGLMALLLIRVPYAAAHMDLARDMFVAWRLLHGQSFPLEGPILAGTVHLGPVWYFVLAALQAIGRSWFGTMALLGLLASTQIPLAYLVGKEFHSRRVGLLWALGLVVPCWTTYEWMLPLHTLLSATSVLAFILCCQRYWHSGRGRYLFGMALTFALALHAHPANLSCAWIGLFVLVRAPQPRPQWSHFILAGLLVLAPLLPFFYADALRDFEDLRRSGSYLVNPAATGNPLNAPSLLLATVYGGTRYLLDPLTGWSAHAAQIGAALVDVAGIAGVWGLLLALRSPRLRGRVLFGCGAVACVLMTAATLRALTPYYMTTAAHVLLAGLVALGLNCLGESLVARSARYYAVAITVAVCLATVYGNARFEVRGAWPFSWWPMFDVLHEPVETIPLLLTPAYAMDDSGQFLCAQQQPSVHGTYGSQLIHNYAMDMRLVCGRADVHTGGAEAGRSHWLGLSRAMFAHIGVRPLQRMGPMGVVPARPVSNSRPLLQPDTPRYPAYLPENKPGTLHHLSVPMVAGDHLAIANLAFAFAVDPQIAVHIGGRDIPVLDTDRVTKVYACTQCDPTASNVAEIDINSGDFDDVDIVLF
jgi:hypothetical protein